MRVGRRGDRPIVDKPAAVAKAPFCRRVEWFQRVDIWAVTERNLLTLAKDSMAGITSDIIVVGGGDVQSRTARWWRWRMRSVR